jgi:hypothetical protein
MTEDCLEDTGTVSEALIEAGQPWHTTSVLARKELCDNSYMIEKSKALPQLTIQETIWNSFGSMLDTRKDESQNTSVLINSVYCWIV